MKKYTIGLKRKNTHPSFHLQNLKTPKAPKNLKLSLTHVETKADSINEDFL